MNIKFEKLGTEHQSALIGIFNYYVENGTAAFPASAVSEKFFAGILEKTNGYPAYSILIQETLEVVGFCFLSAYNPFSTFNETANITYFISQDYVSKGIGEQCLKKLETDAKQIGIKHIIAEISSENKQSLGFHRKHGFITCGSLKNVGNKFNRHFDVVYMQKDLD